jgi:uncharacterized integral membrane protein
MLVRLLHPDSLSKLTVVEENMAKLLIMLIVGFWVSAIALISVQNATPIALRFLTFQSVQLPMGLVIAFSAAIGMVGMAIILPLGRSAGFASSEREDFE